METCYRDIWRGTETQTYSAYIVGQYIDLTKLIFGLVDQTSSFSSKYFIFIYVCHQILQMFEDNYPEGLKRLFVIKGKYVLPEFSLLLLTFG